MIDVVEPSIKTTLIYSNCLRLEPEDGFRKVVSEFAAWIKWKTRVLISPDELMLGAGEYSLPENGRLETFVNGDLQGENLKAVYSHDDPRIEGRRWITEALISQKPGDHKVECTVNLLVSSTVESERGPNSSRPRLIVNLMETCRPVGATPGLYTKPLTLATAEKFLLDVVNPFRKAPLIVISSNWSCDPPINPERLREQLVGLANVYHITEDTDTWDLSEVVGDAYAVYGEAIRIIWPVVPGRTEPSSLLVLPRGKHKAPRTALQMETAVFLSVLRRHIQDVQKG